METAAICAWAYHASPPLSSLFDRGYALITCLSGCSCSPMEVDLTFERRESPILPEGIEVTQDPE